MKYCLDLFSGLGGFSQVFEESDDWEVTTVDVEERFNPDIRADIRDLRPSDFEKDYDLILAGHPCTYFSKAAHHDQWDKETREPVGEEAREHTHMVYHTLGLIRALGPEFWFLENPTGRMRWILGKPTGTITLCQYGFPWQKPTDLWGEHPGNLEYKECSRGGDCHQSSSSGFDSGEEKTHIRDPAERAKLPYELSKSIFDAVENNEGSYQTAALEW